jgi:hypothetical protein
MRGNSARSALAGQGAAAEAAARFALLCQCSPPATTAIAFAFLLDPKEVAYCTSLISSSKVMRNVIGR